MQMSKLRTIGRKPILFSFFSLIINNDKVVKDSTTVQDADVSEVKETGMDRLKRMFSVDEHENISLEVSSIIQVACMSSFIGALYGGVMSSRTAYMDFVTNNQATMFRDHLEAKKKLQDKVTFSFGRGAFRWGWRLSLFSTVYITTSTTISVYRGKFGIIEHVAAGAIAGLLYKLPAGPRGWVVGAALGCVLGSFAGTITYTILSLTGMSMDEIRYWQYQWKEARKAPIINEIRRQKEKEELLILHNMKVGESGKNIENIGKTEN